ncbi:MAG: hypothetical protein LBV31_00700 [Prevotellaceae bacterium]|jgi:hypothetical protein|nr:hypothetical protein [Prevotellaceae bacterium]
MNNNEKILHRFGRENHFRVPDAYFHHSQNRITNAISLQISKKQQRLLLYRRLSAAASAAIIITVGSFSYRSYHQQMLANQQDAYETYLMAQIDDNSLMEYCFPSEIE